MCSYLSLLSAASLPALRPVRLSPPAACRYPIKPVSYFCPVSCGCHRGFANCPDTCPERETGEAICHAYQATVPALGGGPWIDSATDGNLTCPILIETQIVEF